MKAINKIKTRINWPFLLMWWVLGGLCFFLDDYKFNPNITIPLMFTGFIFLIVSIDGIYESFEKIN